MPKAFCISGMVISALLFLVFAMDLAVGVPFKGGNMLMDVGFLVCAALLGYLGWATFREQT
jgi:hypothetical protein